MLVLLEGVNCCGKSTVARWMQRRLGWPILKMDVPPRLNSGGVKDYFVQALEKARSRANGGPHIIVDRYHHSNVAYAGRLGGGVMEEGHWDEINRWLQEIEPQHHVLLLEDMPLRIAERLRERVGRDDGANLLDLASLVEIKEAFVKRIRQAGELVDDRSRYSQVSLRQLVNSRGVSAPEGESLLVRLEAESRWPQKGTR